MPPRLPPLNTLPSFEAAAALVADELAAGRLVRPFALSLPASFAWYVVCPPRALLRPGVKALRDWLLAEAR
jgi:LysR family glycine cleavage system transcriptional activator